MIPNQWYAVLDPREVPRGRPVIIALMNEGLFLLKDDPMISCRSHPLALLDEAGILETP
jgi:hypothetical protein